MPPELIQKVKASFEKKKGAFSFLVGFDGFQDHICQAVKVRYDSRTFAPFEKMKDFLQTLSAAEGKGINIELVTVRKKIGGNGPILAEALCQLGFKPTLIGALGSPDIEPLFLPLTDRCKRVFSIAPSGKTDAIEFQDGKIMLGHHESILNISDSCIIDKIGHANLVSCFSEADIFVSTNWTMLFGLTNLWRYLGEKIFPKLGKKPKWGFIDLADPAKRKKEDLLDALSTLKWLQSFFPVVLGLNELEAKRVLGAIGVAQNFAISCTKKDEVEEMANLVQMRTGLSGIVIHTQKMAASSFEGKTASVDGIWVEKPAITTGAGDNFNAGFLTALACDLSQKEALLLGVATAALYCKNGVSSNLDELTSLL